MIRRSRFRRSSALARRITPDRVIAFLETNPIAVSSTLGDIEGPIDKSLGTKEALAGRLRKLAIDGEQSFQV